MEIKMANNEANANAEAAAVGSPTCMESVNRIAKLPVVESTIQTATSIYSKVKDYNSLTNWTLSTAESAVNKTVEVGKPIVTPVVQNFEGPIRKVDNVLCAGLDYVENKVPAVKLPPSEVYTTTKDYVNNTVTPAVVVARAYVEPTVKAALDKADPAIQTAKQIAEPVIEKAKTAVEPLVQPVLDKARAVKEYGSQKVDEYLHNHHEGEEVECNDCMKVKKQ